MSLRLSSLRVVRNRTVAIAPPLFVPPCRQQMRHHPSSSTGIQRRCRYYPTTTPSKRDSHFVSVIVDQIKSFSIGSLAGLLGSLAGMGGGFVMIPMMTAAKTVPSTWIGLRGLGLNQHQAHGTSLFAVGTTGLAGAFGYGICNIGDENEETDDNKKDAEETQKEPPIPFLTALQQNAQQAQSQVSESDRSTSTTKGVVELDIALALATTAMITARWGAIASSKLSERLLQRALGTFMICVAPLVTGKTYLAKLYEIQRDGETDFADIERRGLPNHFINDADNVLHRIERFLPASLIGMFSGFLSGMFGIGGGSIVVPSLVLTTNMSYHSALGTSLCAMVLPAMVGTYTHSKRGNVNWRVAPMLAMGSAVGAYFGGKEIGLNVEEDVLRVGFSCLMLALGVKTLLKGSR